MKLSRTGIIGLILTGVGIIVEIFLVTQVIRHLTDVWLGYITINLNNMNILLAFIIVGSIILAVGTLALGFSIAKGS
ncbi:MAG: hypothetical protein LUQ65_09675 [Candidatus Helarchaeota archaeon]|nr:hypothetical protein [Candidatus Helarchaeota archaeon]